MKFDEKPKRIRAKFAAEVEQKLGKFVTRYREQFGNYLCTDNALELCPFYKNTSPEKKVLYAPAIDEIASKIVKATYAQILKEPTPEGKHSSVAFVMGGMASGKSSTINRVKEKHLAVYEVIKGLSEEKIELALSHNRGVAVYYIHRPVEQTVPSLIRRSEKIGRTPTIKQFAEGHYQSQKIFLERTKKYQANPHFTALIIGNLDKTGKSKEIALDLFIQTRYSSIEKTVNKTIKAVKKYEQIRIQQGKPIAEFVRKRLYYKIKIQERQRSRKSSERIATNNDGRFKRSSNERYRKTQKRKSLSRTSSKSRVKTARSEKSTQKLQKHQYSRDFSGKDPKNNKEQNNQKQKSSNSIPTKKHNHQRTKDDDYER